MSRSDRLSPTSQATAKQPNVSNSSCPKPACALTPSRRRVRPLAAVVASPRRTQPHAALPTKRLGPQAQKAADAVSIFARVLKPTDGLSQQPFRQTTFAGISGCAGLRRPSFRPDRLGLLDGAAARDDGAVAAFQQRSRLDHGDFLRRL